MGVGRGPGEAELNEPKLSEQRPGLRGTVGTGTRVEVVNRFTASWSRGFVVAAVLEDGYRVERLSDGSVLPVVFPAGDVRAEAQAPFA